MTGTSSVCITATTMPAKASTGTTAAPALRSGWSVVVWVMGQRPSARDECCLNLVCTGNYSVASGL